MTNSLGAILYNLQTQFNLHTYILWYLHKTSSKSIHQLCAVIFPITNVTIVPSHADCVTLLALC